MAVALSSVIVMGCGSSSGGSSGTTSGVNSGTTTASNSNTTPTPPPPSTPPSTPPPSTPPTTPGGAIPTTTDNIYYEPQVRQVLLTYCTSCHASPSNAAAFNAYQLTGFPSDTGSFNNTVARVDASDPEASTLMRKAIGLDGHTKIIDRADTGYAWLVNWVRQGSRFDQFQSGPSTYTRDVQPFVDRQCFGCHSGGAGGFSITANVTNNYNELLSVTETANPTQSRVLLKTDGTINHNGGAPWGANTAERAAILKWIADGRRFSPN